MADADICAAASRLLIHWDSAFDATTQRQSISHPHSHAAKSSPSPSFSAESSESYPLSRCSSISSLCSTAASTCESDSDGDDEDDDGGKFILVSILKKPRRWRRDAHSQAQQRNHCANDHPSSSNNNSGKNSDNNHKNNNDYNYAGDGEGEAYYEDDEDGDDESECEIVFERNVTFDDPLATDIVTGEPIKPSPLSRLEWTALKSRECLDREREEFGRDRKESEEAWEEFEEDQFRGRSLGEELEELEDEEIPKTWGRYTDMDMHEHEHDESAREEGKRLKQSDDDVEDAVLEITETAVQLVAQGQQRRQDQQQG
ncbi:hypothetical protein F5Y10DRAFT_242333 [Nemania abortiva]|nr:hypothetical protein F5Y10DRAFT_242333 [Nemania abortiva]